MTATDLVHTAQARGLWLTLAESCTGGLIAARLTDIPGASAVFDRGFVTYSNAAKTELLGVEAALILRHGAVSEQVAMAMAEGALARSRADVALSVTGIAGPGGGTPAKPVGLVWFGLARRGRVTRAARHVFVDLGRDHIRAEATATGLGLLLSAVQPAQQ